MCLCVRAAQGLYGGRACMQVSLVSLELCMLTVPCLCCVVCACVCVCARAGMVQEEAKFQSFGGAGLCTCMLSTCCLQTIRALLWDSVTTLHVGAEIFLGACCRKPGPTKNYHCDCPTFRSPKNAILAPQEYVPEKSIKWSENTQMPQNGIFSDHLIGFGGTFSVREGVSLCVCISLCVCVSCRALCVCECEWVDGCASLFASVFAFMGGPTWVLPVHGLEPCVVCSGVCVGVLRWCAVSCPLGGQSCSSCVCTDVCSERPAKCRDQIVRISVLCLFGVCLLLSGLGSRSRGRFGVLGASFPQIDSPAVQGGQWASPPRFVFL